ncbi:MAG: RidA family protein, partial [Phycicoccus sp.]
MPTVAERLAALGLTVPPLVPPVAAYLPAVLDGSRVYVSGQVPMADGALLETGLVGEGSGLVAPERAAELARV